MNPPPLRTYIRTWAALLALLALTCGSAFIPLGPVNTLLNFAVAVAKALLVATFFMHLRYAPALVRILAVTALFMLALLFALSGTDYATRQVTDAPWSATAGRP
jgi:cytochrome c oxidase subunit IV